ncbi:MAG: acetyl-CoA carboxylase biotin carboxylase subunit [Betaproteobacteria bacterium]
MFNRLLIANRGEIAVRVARTARRMGVRTIAVFSDADADAMHVEACDEAFRVGGAAPRESYLDGARILAIARAAHADAIHPGYGFLSENAAFATACADAGIVFVGPPPSAIEAMGSKSAAKRIMQRAGVPLVPGYHGDDQSPELLAREAQAIGFPVLIKATAGGGGKGMKVAESAAAFGAALASAKREALAGFGDDRMLVEKYLSAPRHIEIQVFADAHGSAIHLFERDCSVQRRHQKVLEEAPAPGMTTERRLAMGEAAVAAARAIGYVGAGTVEFIAEQDGRFFFMEMNTRLQVEHPVTEMITGLDLVEWQLRVAAGEPLPRTQQQVAIHGHAIEARIYAEDPQRDFLPSIGGIVHWRMAEATRDVRVDTGFRAGDTVTPFYDPMLAKLIVHGDDRDAALRRMHAALAQCEVVGVTTNVAFLERMVTLPDFVRANLDTGLIERNRRALLGDDAPVARDAPPAPADARNAASAPTERTIAIDRALIAAAIAEWRAHADAMANGDDLQSPWNAVDAWWLNSRGHRVVFEFDAADGRHRVSLRPRHGDVVVETARGTSTVRVEPAPDGGLVLLFDGVRIRAHVVVSGLARHVFGDGLRHRFVVVDPMAGDDADAGAGGHLRAPMSGTIVAVLVKAGEHVTKGAPLVVLEAMKMEHTIVATSDGRVDAVNCAVGERVAEGADLVDIES